MFCIACVWCFGYQARFKCLMRGQKLWFSIRFSHMRPEHKTRVELTYTKFNVASCNDGKKKKIASLNLYVTNHISASNVWKQCFCEIISDTQPAWLQVALLAAATTGRTGVKIPDFGLDIWASEAISKHLILKLVLEEHAVRPSLCALIQTHSSPWSYKSKIAAFGAVKSIEG